MITCKLHHLASRCAERGYTFDEIKPCIVSQDGDTVVVDETHASYPKQSKNESKDLPSLLTRVKNFTIAAASHIKSGMPMSTEEEVERRYGICSGCEFLKDNACTKCGCPINRKSGYISKLSWADQHCPIGKW